MIEQNLSHFKILEEIGSGGMGVVYRAVDLRLQRTVALKVLPQGSLSEPRMRERFMREARTASSLNHRNIVTVYTIDQAGDRDVIAMEYVTGQPLDKVVGEHGLELERALRYGVQIAEALACAHEHGVIHRDLKPQNIMLTVRDEMKVLDFGLARRILPTELEERDPNDPQPPSTLTADGTLAGTPGYMSPEQVEGKPVDARGDIFSFGCVFYQMLTGIPPFHRDTPIRILSAVLTDEPPPLRSLRPDLPAEVDRILAKTLDKDPETRYQNMRELLTDLREVQGEHFETSGIKKVKIPASWRVSTQPAPKRSPALLIASVLLLTVAAAAVGWYLSRSRSTLRLTDFRLVSTFAGSHRQACFSPSGELITFVSEDRDGIPQVWVKGLTQGKPIQITSGNSPAGFPRWSPDNDQIVFVRRDEGIWSVPPLGGPPRRLVEYGTHPSFSADGERLVFEHDKQIWLVNADGTGLERLDAVPAAYFAEWVSRSPSFSPDGRKIAYFEPLIGPLGNLWSVDVEGGGKPRLLNDKPFRGGDPIWTPDGRWIIFWSNLHGGLTLSRISARGGHAEPLTTGAGEDTEPTLSFDGRRLIYTTARNNYSLMRYVLETGQHDVLFESRRAIVVPSLSKAGDRIAFFSPVPDFHLFTISIDGTDLLQVTRNPGEKNIIPQWSSDGQYLYYYQEQPSPSLRRVPASGGESTEVIADWSWGVQNRAALSPEESRVAYTLFVDGAPHEAWVRDLASGKEIKLERMIRVPRWSRDGNSLIGTDADGFITRCPVSEASCERLAHGYNPRWAPDGRSVYFLREGKKPPNQQAHILEVWLLDLQSHTEKMLTDLESVDLLTFEYEVLPNGDIVWNQFRPGRNELWLADVH